MSVLLRTLLACLLALALPLQGVLAATGAHCAPSQHGGVVAHPASHTGGGTGGHHHDCEHAAAGDAGPAASAAAADGALAPDASCSACAACCAPGTAPAPAHGLPKAAGLATVFLDAPATVEAFASSGPDRPPRREIG